MTEEASTVIWFDRVALSDVPRVGGKNASLGEMIRKLSDKGIHVPQGFATTAEAYRRFVGDNGLREVITFALDELASGKAMLSDTGEKIRRAFLCGQWSNEAAEAIKSAYAELCKRSGQQQVDVAVRSSATAEDLPGASFAGLHETFLNIRGDAALLDACRRCFASLFRDRAISYRHAKGFDHLKIALSVGVQRMVRSDWGARASCFQSTPRRALTKWCS